MGTIKQFKALFLIRLRLLYNTIRNKAGLGKLIGMSFAAFIMIIATASGASDILEAIFKLPFANIIAEWCIGTLIIYAIFIVFTGDLVSGHTLNTGQMSSDFNYLSTLPLSPTILILTKVFERLITDYFGILFLLPAFIGISCYKAFTFNAIAAALLLYFEISFLIGLSINLVMICLTRFFKNSTINNFFSIFGYISALLTLIPFLMLSNFNPSHVPKVIETIDYLQTTLGCLLSPIKWMASTILYSTPFSMAFLKFSILWLITSAFLTFLFRLAIVNNWFAYVHSNKSVSSAHKGRRLFTGLFRKEFLMIKSDLNLLVNAILMPISIIAVEIYFLKRVFSFTSVDSIMNFIFGSIIYFSMFGPINIIGYEGKAISLLETMPISPARLIKKKYTFWVIIALIIFIPAAIITFRTLGFDWSITTNAALLTAAFTLASVWITVSLSAIFAKYDAKVLQQHSTFLGKMTAMALMSLLLPLKSLTWLNVYSLLVFIILAILCYTKAQTLLVFRQDKEALNSPSYCRLNCFLLFLSFAAIEASINQFLYYVIPDTDTGIWSWCLTLAISLPFFLLIRKSSSPIFPKANFKDIIKSVTTALLSLAVAIIYLKYNQNLSATIINNSNHIAEFCKILFIPQLVWKIIMFILAVLMMTTVVKRSEEVFLSEKNKLLVLLGNLLILLVSLNSLIPFIAVYLMILTIFTLKQSKTSVSFYSSILFFSGIFYYLIF
ncbi:MAG: hypothetical protein II567_03220 [Candidatus Riflebacteria bacterium]|nr:hypothetical protein [Candidatus Riflebacteria bacterium]